MEQGPSPLADLGEVSKKTVNAWRKAQFTARTKAWLSRWFAWSRR